MVLKMIPSKIQLHKKSRTLELDYLSAQGEESFTLPAEFLRVHSPSAEVKGHGPGQEVLQTGKLEVGIDNIAAAGNYALQIFFDDGHDSGIFTWQYLHQLCLEQDQLWVKYLDKLAAAGKDRDPNTSTVKFIQPK